MFLWGFLVELNTPLVVFLDAERVGVFAGAFIVGRVDKVPRVLGLGFFWRLFFFRKLLNLLLPEMTLHRLSLRPLSLLYHWAGTELSPNRWALVGP